MDIKNLVLLNKENNKNLPFSIVGGEKAFLYKNGNIKSIFLEKDTSYKGLTFQAQTWLRLHPNKEIDGGYLSKNGIYGNIHVQGGKGKPSSFSCYESGKLDRAHLSEIETISLGNFVFDFEKKIYFHENGIVRKGYQANDTTLDVPYTFRISKGLMHFYDNGDIAYCLSDESIELNYAGSKYYTQENTPVRLNKINDFGYASLQMVYMKSNTTIGEFVLKPKTHLLFNGIIIDSEVVFLHNNGVLKKIKTASNFVHQKIKIEKGDRIGFYNNWRLERIQPSRERVIENIKLCAWGTVYFNIEGNVMSFENNC
jgi:hypothetical protein